MINLRLFTILFVLFAFNASVFSSDIGKEIPSGSETVEPSQADAEKKTEKAETVVEPYKTNPVAVKAVDKSLYLFTDRIKERFSVYLSRSGKYLELMKDILKNKNIPEDMVFLSLIESGFNPYAYSVARAVGPWQFIASTAKRYGLVIDFWRDERRDPVKSTEAAANYLKDLYDMFGSWNLAMAAYNAGEGKILRALNRTKSDDYWSLLKTRHIKSETKSYVPHFIAANIIADNPEEFGFKNISYHPPLEYDEVTINGPLDLEVAAQCAETTLAIIRELNPELRRWCTPPDMPVYTLRIPAGTKDAFVRKLSEIPEDERFTVEKYTVRKGDTVEKIAKSAGVTSKSILVLNHLSGPVNLKTGSDINLPPKEKFELDRDDRYEMKKSSKKFRKVKTYKAKKQTNRKVLVTAMNTRAHVVND